ncbi:MAG TPA: lipid-binding SYLF domain-containing protein [Geminicoccaceae bacterium]|nr:lipid-binding SYLF domain-containing protein [Geminicoccus sp.]HMU51187.1 lipid-binding SYLF domain-containing protein [Geminicoccaceae bacterium]
MLPITRRLTVAGLVAAAFGVTLRPALANDQQRLVERARLALDEFHDDPSFEVMRVYVQNAQGIAIFPELLKAGLIVGVEAGSGLLMVRNESTGAFGDPAFYDLYEGSFGLQIGGASTSVVLTIMNRPAIDKILTSKFKMGTDASVAAGPVGPGVGAATTTRFGEDIYTFSRSRGLYAGLSLDGAALLPKNDWNEAFYGVKATPAAILRGDLGLHTGTQALRDAVARF